MRSLEQQFEAAGGRPAGFDYLRLALAIAVMAWHAPLLCYGEPYRDAVAAAHLVALANFIVPSFFALSGFLVAGSLDRNDLPSFLTLRGLRIFPALCMEVAISALLLGLFFTSLPLADYVTDPRFRAYFLNVFGYIHYQLPGVFQGNPWGDRVNGQLWTVPFELECYAALSLLALLKLHKSPWLFLALGLAACAVLTALEWYNPIPSDVAKPPGRMVVACFLLGVALFRLKARIPFNGWLFAASLGASWLLLGDTELIYLAPLPVAYATAYLGLLNPPRSLFSQAADYSYGIYLYGYPVQQALVAALPDHRTWWFNLAAGLALTGVLAAVSWHLVEKPVLDRRKVALAWVRRTTLRIPVIRRLVWSPA